MSVSCSKKIAFRTTKKVSYSFYLVPMRLAPNLIPFVTTNMWLCPQEIQR